MKKFQYQIVRYMHDRVTAEFVNVGIIIYQPETKFLQGQFITKFSRISQFFSDINGQYLLATLRQFENEVIMYSNRLTELFGNPASLTEITNSILTKDDSALYCSDLCFGIDVSMQAALDDLFVRLINLYTSEPDKDQHDDKYVWRKVYKQYFDKYEITNKLKSHTVKTDNDEIEFDKSWKNGVWNCYQTLSFDLKRNDTIKNKVYKWSGILNELKNSNEKLNLYFLTVRPSLNQALNKFIDDTILKYNTGQSLKITLVNENEAETFAAGVNKEIEEYQAIA